MSLYLKEEGTDAMSNLDIAINTHSSIKITDGKLVIYVDPFGITAESHDADVVFVTHDHYDHFSPEDIARVAKTGTVLVCPEKMGKKAESDAAFIERFVTVKPGTFCEVSGLEVEAIAAYNVLKPFHPKACENVGYVIRIGGKRVYIAGDTDETKEAKAVKCDIALVPVGGTYTMDAKKAAELVNTIKPELAIPTHYGSIVGNAEDGEAFKKLVNPQIKVEIKI
jgi:L-ascorbate metabolism protein UlaG (beta-lactamase superfamily)